MEVSSGSSLATVNVTSTKLVAPFSMRRFSGRELSGSSKKPRHPPQATIPINNKPVAFRPARLAPLGNLGLTPVRAGLLLSLAPSAAQLFYFFPMGGAGWLGAELGGLTPLFVLAANAVWGWVLARVIIAAGES